VDAKPQVLAAFPPPALAKVAEILGAHVELVAVSSMAQACERLANQRDLALVLCGVHFDDSRMYDLLRYVRLEFPQLPFVCCRIVEAELAKISRESIRIAAASLGASAFVDYPELAASLGPERAAQEVRALLFGQLAV
jgi:hypothetical protein